MPDLVPWIGFAGAWLLVAGPVYQAVLELRAHEGRREQFAAMSAKDAYRPPPVPRRWWLLPPVHGWLQRRRSRAAKDAFLADLDPAQLAGLLRFIDKATGWLLVAAGALLIAVKETWELAEHGGWPVAGFWLLLVLMALACASITAALVKRTQVQLDRAAARRTARGA